MVFRVSQLERWIREWWCLAVTCRSQSIHWVSLTLGERETSHPLCPLTCVWKLIQSDAFDKEPTHIRRLPEIQKISGLPLLPFEVQVNHRPSCFRRTTFSHNISLWSAISVRMKMRNDWSSSFFRKVTFIRLTQFCGTNVNTIYSATAKKIYCCFTCLHRANPLMVQTLKLYFHCET